MKKSTLKKDALYMLPETGTIQTGEDWILAIDQALAEERAAGFDGHTDTEKLSLIEVDVHGEEID